MAGMFRTTVSTMRKRSKLYQGSAFFAGVLLIFLMLHSGRTLKGDQFVFPGIREIFGAFFSLLQKGETYREIGVTMVHVIEALGISMAAGTAIGLAEGLNDFIYRMLRPMMILLRSIPMIVLIILLMVLIPYASVPIAASSLILIPLISEAVCTGCREIEQEMIDAYRINSRLNLSVLLHVYIPLTGGYLRQAFINGAGMGLKIIISAEYLVQTKHSLGKAIYSSSYFLNYADIYAYALIMILLILLVTDLPIGIIRRRSGFSK